MQSSDLTWGKINIYAESGMRTYLCLFLLIPTMLVTAQETIENGLKPVRDRLSLTLTENLRLGQGAVADHLLWTGSGVAVEVDAQGRMYVVDPDDCNIAVFAEDGTFLKTIGRKGKGPGEFEILSGFDLLADGSMVAFENLQGLTYFHFFNQAGEFVKRDTNQPIKCFLQSVDFSPNGRYLSAMFLSPHEDGEHIWVNTGILNRELDTVLRLSQLQQSAFDQSQSGLRSYWAAFLAQWFRLGVNGLGLTAFTQDSGAFSAVSTVYEIQRWSPDMKKTLTIKKKYQPKIQSEEEIEAFVEPLKEQMMGALPSSFKAMITDSVVRKALELAEFPPIKPALYALIPVEDKGLLVISEYHPLTGVARSDFFDHEGYFRGDVEMPPLPVNLFSVLTSGAAKMVFKNGHAYAILLDENQEASLVRYRYEIH